MKVLLTLLLALCACVDGPPARERMRLATTTSTHNSGLLDEILPPFEKRENIEVQVIAVGTGQALALGQRGDADLLLVHARGREDEFVAAGYGVDRRDVMWNDFVIIGPPDDPAGVRGLADAREALGRIRMKRARFVSRGDDSGTHIREQSLWGSVPTDEKWYLDAGQGMGRCLIIANEKRAYLLTDRGTYHAFEQKLDLEILVEGDAALRNPYGAILVNPQKHEGLRTEAARKLLDYLTSPDCQRRIADFRVDGQVLFHSVVEDEG